MIQQHVPQFRVGDIVVMSAYTDGDGRFHPDTPPLTVASLRTIDSTRGRANERYTYQRLMAYGPGLSSYEGAARFFRHAGTR